jgi:hypothetical protein
MPAAALLLAAAFGTAAAPRDGIYARDGRRYQTVWVTGTRGAACTLARDGKTIAELTIGTADAVAEVDVTHDHAALTLTCAANGAGSLTKKLSWGKQACGPEECAATALQYPAAVPVFLGDAPPTVPLTRRLP